MINTSQIITHAARLGNLEVLKELIKQKVDINLRDEKGYTPLIISVFNNRYDATKLLLEAGADINIKDSKGNTALMYANLFDRDEIAKLLLKHEADKIHSDSKDFFV